MSKKKDKPLIKFPLDINIDSTEIIERKTLVINPDKISPSEVKIVKVSRWYGLKNQYFAVQNVDGKLLNVVQLDEKTIQELNKKNTRS